MIIFGDFRRDVTLEIVAVAFEAGVGDNNCLHIAEPMIPALGRHNLEFLKLPWINASATFFDECLQGFAFPFSSRIVRIAQLERGTANFKAGRRRLPCGNFGSSSMISTDGGDDTTRL